VAPDRCREGVQFGVVDDGAGVCSRTWCAAHEHSDAGIETGMGLVLIGSGTAPLRFGVFPDQRSAIRPLGDSDGCLYLTGDGEGGAGEQVVRDDAIDDCVEGGCICNRCGMFAGCGLDGCFWNTVFQGCGKSCLT